jgi:hypothetical protein
MEQCILDIVYWIDKGVSFLDVMALSIFGCGVLGARKLYRNHPFHCWQTISYELGIVTSSLADTNAQPQPYLHLAAVVSVEDANSLNKLGSLEVLAIIRIMSWLWTRKVGSQAAGV